MKFALCISGQMRTYKKCYGYIYENILSELNPDVFVHTWRLSGSTTKGGAGKNREERVNKNTLDKLYDPKLVKIERFEDEWFSEKDGVKVPKLLKEKTMHWKGNIPMFYKIKKCNNLKKKFENEKELRYDIVIRMRPDLIVPNKIPDRVISQPSILWYSGAGINTAKQVSDKLAISSSENMDYYSSVWDQLNKYWQDPLGEGDWKSIRVGERLMRHHMNESSININPFSVGCEILRRDMDFIREEGKEAAREEARQNLKIPLSDIAAYFGRKLSSVWSRVSF